MIPQIERQVEHDIAQVFESKAIDKRHADICTTVHAGRMQHIVVPKADRSRRCGVFIARVRMQKTGYFETAQISQGMLLESIGQP